LDRNTHEAREGGLSKPEFDTCERAIASMKNVSQKNWLEGLRKGTVDVAVALLLSRMSHLRTVEIRVRPGSVAGSTIFEALTLPESFTRTETIKSVIISVDWDEGGDPFQNPWEENMFDIAEHAPGLFHIPRVESLSIHCFAPSGSLWRGWKPFASSLKILSLKHGNLKEYHLKTILHATPNLEELDCSLVYDHELEEILNCIILHTALGQASKSLKSIKICIDLHFDDGWDVLNTMGSMKHFEKLKYYPTQSDNNSTCANTVFLDTLKFR
jgi:hypothetical protein